MKIRLDTIVFDPTVYPRTSMDDTCARSYEKKMRAGIVFPPILVDKSTKKIIDGWKRSMAAKWIGLEDIDGVYKTLKDDRAIFLESIRLNAPHGQPLDTADKIHCLIAGDKFKISMEVLASALQLSVDDAKELRSERVGKLWTVGKHTRVFPLKPATRHMSGTNFTPEQEEVNASLGGDTQIRMLRQLIGIVRTGLVAPGGSVRDLYWELHDLIEKNVSRASKEPVCSG